MFSGSGEGGGDTPVVPDNPQPTTCTVTITGTGKQGSSTYASVVVDGVTYTSATTVTVTKGTVITVKATGNSSDGHFYGYIYLNSTSQTVKEGMNVSYDLEVINDTSIELVVAGFAEASLYAGEVYITTNSSSGGGSSANLINFTIGGKSYQAEEGMTWNDWVSSNYNTNSYSLKYGSNVIDSTGLYVVPSGTNTAVLYYDDIISNGRYELKQL